MYVNVTLRRIRATIAAVGKQEILQISRQSASEGGKVVSPTHRSPLPPRNIPGTYFC
jgi:hypothetical protein